MGVNDKAFFLDERVALETFAGKPVSLLQDGVMRRAPSEHHESEDSCHADP